MLTLTQSYLKLFGIRWERKDTHDHIQSNAAGTVSGGASSERRKLPVKQKSLAKCTHVKDLAVLNMLV